MEESISTDFHSQKKEQAEQEARRAALLEPLLRMSYALRRNGETELVRSQSRQ